MNQPIQGQVYALTGGTGTKCIANGNTWEEPRVIAEKKWQKEQEKKRETKLANMLVNEYVEVNFDGETVRMFDNKDMYNDFKGFSETKLASRAKKAFLLLKESFNEKMTYGEAEEILDSAGAKMHSYCGMD